MRLTIPLAFISSLLSALPLRAASCDGTPRLPGAANVLVLAEGDSITAGVGSSDGRSYVPRTCLLTTNAIEFFDTARPSARLGVPADGSGTNSLYGRLEDDAQLIFAKRQGRRVILTILIGRNDLAGYGAQAYADDLGGYVAAMRGAGVDRVVVGTLLPSAWAPFAEARVALNAILRRPGWAAAHGIDAIADFAASPVMGPDAAAEDKTLFGDGTHPTDRGYELMAPIYGGAIRRAMAGAPTAR